MQEIKLTIHGGGRLFATGSLDAPRILILLSRDQFRQDDTLMARLGDALAGPDLTVVRYESELAVTTRLIDWRIFLKLPPPLRRLAKAAVLLFHPTRWRHYSTRYRQQRNEPAFRSRSLGDLIRSLGPGKDIMVVARSAGGRVASLIADEAGIRKLICLSYPFQHPQEGPDPARYAHLADLRTPLLIIQGVRDTYGGQKDTGKFPLGPNTTLEWIEADHEFALSAEDWRKIARRIGEFIATP